MCRCCDHAQQQIDAFRRPEVRHVDDEKLTIGDSKIAPGVLPAAAWRICREEVRDDLDLVAKLEKLGGLLAQTFRYGRHRIGVDEGVFDGGAILRIRTQQSGICPMQGGDYFRRAFADHLGREKCGGRMRHGVVNVKNVERFGFADLSHFYGERQSVIGAGENGRVTNIDFVELNSREREIEADRFRVTKEMDVVTASGQFGSERGSQNPAAPDERKASDADFERPFHHSPIYARPESVISSRSTNVTPGASASFKYSRSTPPAT